MLKRLGQFLRESRLELKRVTWPSRKETTRLTLVVIGVSAAMAMFLGSLDYLFSIILNRLLF